MESVALAPVSQRRETEPSEGRIVVFARMEPESSSSKVGCSGSSERMVRVEISAWSACHLRVRIVSSFGSRLVLYPPTNSTREPSDRGAEVIVSVSGILDGDAFVDGLAVTGGEGVAGGVDIIGVELEGVAVGEGDAGSGIDEIDNRVRVRNGVGEEGGVRVGN